MKNLYAITLSILKVMYVQSMSKVIHRRILEYNIHNKLFLILGLLFTYLSLIGQCFFVVYSVTVFFIMVNICIGVLIIAHTKVSPFKMYIGRYLNKRLFSIFLK